MSKTPDKLDQLEAQSVYILREAYREFKSLVMLWSIGKDSTVLLWLARKAFFGHVPFPLVHIDTSYKIPEMIKYRDELALKFNLNMVVGQNVQALKDKKTYPDGALDRISCCKALKTDALKNTLSGAWPRKRLNHKTGQYDIDVNTEPYTGVIVGARADEEGSRSKERYFSPRDRNSDWDVGNQPPTEDQVTALAASAIGPANADLRGALRHYGLLRALGPGWVAAMAPTSGDQAAVPGWAVQQMQLFLGSGQPPRP